MTIMPLIIPAIIMMTPVSKAGENNTAIKYSAKAYYIQSGLSKEVKEWEKRFIPKDIRVYGGWVANLIKIGVEQRITYEISF